MKSTFQEFNQIDRQIGSTYHEIALKLGLPDSELWILYTLTVHPPGCLQAEICRETGMTKTTVSSALKKMERNGLLTRSPGFGRNTLVFLTEKGNALCEGTVCRLIEMENRIYESWSPEDQATLLRLNRNFSEQLSDFVKTL